MTAATLKASGDQIIESTPLKRLGRDDDLKGVVLFLASNAARHITGQTVVVDGGSSITGS
jgi:gluconate 5-dehydrogenase